MGDYNHCWGHFSQIVWKTNQKLGVGIAEVPFSGIGKIAVVVFRYSPGGNVIGAFNENVLQPGRITLPDYDKCQGKYEDCPRDQEVCSRHSFVHLDEAPEKIELGQPTSKKPTS